jgi:hypothetical protein
MRIDHREVQLTYHREGCDGVARLIDAGVSRFVLKKALRNLQQDVNGSTSDLTALVDLLRVRGIVSERTGPTKPDAGDERTYRVQEVDGSRFVRLPVNHFGEECEIVSVAFFVGSIKVTPRAEV